MRTLKQSPDGGNSLLHLCKPFVEQPLHDLSWCAGGPRFLCLEACTVLPRILFPDVLGETLAGPVVTLAVLKKADHAQGAPVYALVYLVAPKFYSSTNML